VIRLGSMIVSIGISLRCVAARIVENGVTPTFGFLSRHPVGILLKHVVAEALIISWRHWHPWEAWTSDHFAVTRVAEQRPQNAVRPVSDFRPKPLILGWSAHTVVLNRLRVERLVHVVMMNLKNLSDLAGILTVQVKFKDDPLPLSLMLWQLPALPVKPAVFIKCGSSLFFVRSPLLKTQCHAPSLGSQPEWQTEH